MAGDDLSVWESEREMISILKTGICRTWENTILYICIFHTLFISFESVTYATNITVAFTCFIYLHINERCLIILVSLFGCHCGYGTADVAITTKKYDY